MLCRVLLKVDKRSFNSFCWAFILSFSITFVWNVIRDFAIISVIFSMIDIIVRMLSFFELSRNKNFIDHLAVSVSIFSALLMPLLMSGLILFRITCKFDFVRQYSNKFSLGLQFHKFHHGTSLTCVEFCFH